MFKQGSGVAMIDLSKAEFRFLDQATPEMRKHLRVLAGMFEDITEEDCTPNCIGCCSCSDGVADFWSVRGAKLYAALDNDDAALRLANVPPDASVWDVVDTLPMPQGTGLGIT